ncbi:acyl-CoA N-acyltransferase [Sistotremastrum niveocremeum HHB9708]|uniref:histone acetyltransferase n=1 Tax=Sistotremastrum niveocremeum HHB9708 TaxID=1314777 RepID=A0A164R8K5_9AGAM|nr:acyl-CoA N-acyltransferase [Sistotremastrum niveocremeum HHB9708]
MPRLHPLHEPDHSAEPVYIISQGKTAKHGQVLQRRAADKHVYVHYLNTDKRLDEWIPEDSIRLLDATASTNGINGTNGTTDPPPSTATSETQTRGRKRKRGGVAPSDEPPPSEGGLAPPDVGVSLQGRHMVTNPLAVASRKGGNTSEDEDIAEHRMITARRNFERVFFGPKWRIKTWYFSPYPLSEAEADEVPVSALPTPNGNTPASKSSLGLPRTTMRAHGRTADILAGGLGRESVTGEKSVLWVCNWCFKYMREATPWELHLKVCQQNHPPGRKVYQRGAHIIWEVDGAKEKLYCQNLSLFGKLFIDVKTLFFDCENFLYYLLTDADSTRDHVLCYFSKEKVSYDNYNLACIVTFPPYQGKGYGKLMIDFSYELSRRAAKLETPERPLSDLGLRGYLAYWISVLVRFFRCFPETNRHSAAEGLIELAGGGNTSGQKKRKKSGKEEDDNEWTESDPSSFNNFRQLITTLNPNGSATTNVFIQCTLRDISQATNIRVEDIAFALNECGLLQRRRKDNETLEEVIMLSREMIDKVAAERNIKSKRLIDVKCLLL